MADSAAPPYVGPPADSVARTIQDAMDRWPPAERKVARAILAAYPTAGLETVARLAARAEVSPPTVVRFVTRLGYAGFPAFQDALLGELAERNASPLTLIATRSGRAQPGQLEQTGELFATATERSFQRVPAAEHAAAVSLLADPNRRIAADGGRFSRLLAAYLVLHLTQLRGSSALLPETSVGRVDELLTLRRNDVLVLFDFRRYEDATLELAEAAADRRVQIVLFTDPWMSPVARLAQVVLPAQVDSPSPYDSFVPTLALVESVVGGVVDALGPAAEHRLAEVESLGQRLHLL